MAATTLTLSFPETDIAVLTLDDPQSSANVLSRHVLDALERHLDELDRHQNLAGLVIRSAKPGMFIAGADLKEFRHVARLAEGGSRQLLPPRTAAVRSAVAIELRDGRRDRRHVRRRRRGAGDVVRPPHLDRQRENRLRLSGSETRPVPRLGRHGPHTADDWPVERRRAGHRRRKYRCPHRCVMGLANDVVPGTMPPAPPRVRRRQVATRC